MKTIFTKYLLFTQNCVIYSLLLCFVNEKSKTESTESQKSLRMSDPERQRKKILFGMYVVRTGHSSFVCLWPMYRVHESAHNVHRASQYLLPSHPSEAPTPAQGTCHRPQSTANPKESQRSRTAVLRAKRQCNWIMVKVKSRFGETFLWKQCKTGYCLVIIQVKKSCQFH